jgi:hypothetical protein
VRPSGTARNQQSTRSCTIIYAHRPISSSLHAGTRRHRPGIVRYYRMVDKRRIDIPIVTRFVREVLGCNCPDEVFRRVEVQTGSTAVKSWPTDYEIRIGGRLLVVVTSKPVEWLTDSRLENVIAEGRRARDAGHFNRFRLAVQAENAAQGKEKLLRSFEGVSPRTRRRICTWSRSARCRISSWEPNRCPEPWLKVTEERRLTRHVQNRKRLPALY